MLIIFTGISAAYGAEIDQFTDRQLYQETLPDFTDELNRYTNDIILEAVANSNDLYKSEIFSESEKQKIAAFEIFRLTSGDSLKKYEKYVPSVLSPVFLVRKFVKGPVQAWIESDENSSYWFRVEHNLFSDIYPSVMGLDKSYNIKVNGELLGPDKIDHFFDQGYSYYLISDYGENDDAAIDFGISTELGLYGLDIGGVFSYADLRANWGGYQFYSSLFAEDSPLLGFNESGELVMNRAFDWKNHIDADFDELKNTSVYSVLLDKFTRRRILEHYGDYRKTYDFLAESGFFNRPTVSEKDYLNREIDFNGLKRFSPTEIFEHKPTALVLSGGGAHGAYQIGAWKALMDLGIEIDAVYGVSVGAINGAAIAAGDYDKARSLWLEIDNSNIMNINDSGQRVLSGEYSLSDIFNAADEIASEGGIDIDPLRKLINNTIDEDAIRKNVNDFGLIAFSLSDYSEHAVHLCDIPDGQLADWVLASGNYPLFKRSGIGEEVFIDGGVINNIAIELVDPEKYNNVIMITINSFYSVHDIFDHTVGYNNYDFNITHIQPGSSFGSSVLEFNPAASADFMRMGYLDTLKKYGILEGIRYYIYNDDAVQRMYFSLTPEERFIAAEMLEVDEYYTISDLTDPASFYTVIRPELLQNSISENVLLEDYASILEIDNSELYSQSDLCNLISATYLERDQTVLEDSSKLDFISYLCLKTKYIDYTAATMEKRFLDSYNSFLE